MKYNWRKITIISLILVVIIVGCFFLGIFDDTSTITVGKGEKILFTDQRPDSSDPDIIGCFPAAYSGKNGIIGHYSTGKKRKGTSDYRYTTINLDGNTHFQQVSLVRNHNPKKFSDNRLRYRRALCKKDGKYFIIQSKYPITLNRFAENLTDNDFAWNLDMGTYSYGWYKKDGKLHQVGISTFWNKDKQTNWIVIKI